MKITAVICTYNGLSRGFLEEAINSVISQSRRADEFILVDDGSTDGTATWVLEKYEDIRVISKSNEGLPAARNTAINASTSDFLAFLDDDDVWHREKLKIQLDLLNKETSVQNTELIVFSPIKLIDEHSSAIGYSNGTFGLYQWPFTLLANEITAPSGVLFSKELCLKIGLFDPKIRIDAGEDYNFWIRASKQGVKFISTTVALVSYRIHRSQATNAKKRLTACLQTDLMLSEFYDQLNASTKEQFSFLRLIVVYRALFRITGIRQANEYLKTTVLRKYLRARPEYLKISVWFMIDTVVTVFARGYRKNIFWLFFKAPNA